MIRTLALLDLAIGALLRRRGRTLAVGAVFAGVVALFTSVLLVTASLRREHHTLLRHTPDVTVQRMRAGRPAEVPLAIVPQVQALAGVRKVVPRVWGYLFIPTLRNNVTVLGVDDPARLADLGASLSRGRAPRPGERGTIVLGRALAEILSLAPGNEVGFDPPGGGRPRYYRVVGLFGAESALLTADAMVMHTDDARRFFGLPDDVATDLAVTLSAPEEGAVLARKVVEILPDARVVERRLQARTYEVAYGWRGGLLFLALFPSALALAVLLWDRATALGEVERREIGVLKAVGWETRDVLALKVMEAAALALVSTGAGLALATSYVHWLGAPGLFRLLGGWSVLLPAFDLRPALGVTDLFVVAATVTLPYLLAAAVPAWRVATLEPDEAMRG